MGRLPKILCLHGTGSSAAIFKVQSRMIQQVFRNEFEFVFVNAPFQAGIGPDMLPYSDSGPFYRWHAEETKSDYLGLGPEDVERERAIVGDYLREVIFNGPSSGSFVGVMGFSNGAAVATSLILERHELALLWGEMPSFQFAWLFCGTYPPVTLLPPELRAVSSTLDTVCPSFPSVHMHGLRDPYLLQSRKLLYKVYKDAGFTQHVEFAGSHHMPVKMDDVQRFRRAAESVMDEYV